MQKRDGCISRPFSFRNGQRLGRGLWTSYTGSMKINKLSDQLNWSVIILFGSIRVRSCGDARGQPLPAHLPPRPVAPQTAAAWVFEYNMIEYSKFNH